MRCCASPDAAQQLRMRTHARRTPAARIACMPTAPAHAAPQPLSPSSRRHRTAAVPRRQTTRGHSHASSHARTVARLDPRPAALTTHEIRQPTAELPWRCAGRPRPCASARRSCGPTAITVSTHLTRGHPTAERRGRNKRVDRQKGRQAGRRGRVKHLKASPRSSFSACGDTAGGPSAAPYSVMNCSR